MLKLICGIIFILFITCNNNPSNNSNINPDYEFLLGSWIYTSPDSAQIKLVFKPGFYCQTFFPVKPSIDFCGDWLVKQDSIIFINTKTIEYNYSNDTLVSTDTTSGFVIEYRYEYEIVDTNQWRYLIDGLGWFDYFRITE